MNKFEFVIKNLNCANCAAEVEQALSECEGFENVTVNFSTSKIKFRANISTDQAFEQVKTIVKKTEPDARVLRSKEADKNRFDFLNLGLFLAGLIFSAVVLFAPLGAKHSLINAGHSANIADFSAAQVILSFASAAVLCFTTFVRAVLILIRSRRVDENLLICLSVFGAIAIGSVLEGLMVIVLYQIGKLLEGFAVARSRKSVAALMRIKAPYANLLREGVFVKSDVDEIKIGDIFEVRPGEIIATDGIVRFGESSLNQAGLTGESAPVFVRKGDKVMSGVIVTDGVLEVEATAVCEDSTAAKILELIENASDKKSPAETIVSRAAKYYTPIVLGLSIAALLLLPLFGLAFKEAFYRALTFLVISCPCAIAISVPLTYFAGLGYAGSRGILIKGSNYLDNFLNIKHLVLDKTGTLTTGNFKVKSVEVMDTSITQDEVLKILASGEAKSNHPLAVAVCKEYKGAPYKILNYKELSGRGISFKIGKDEYFAGAPEGNLAEQALTSIVLIKNKKPVAHIYLEDEIKQGARELVQFFTSRKVTVHMLTGDNEFSARRVAGEVGIAPENVHFRLLPKDKYNFVENLISARRKNQVVAFAGDGINDTPVIMLSDVGIAMGGLGSQSSVEAGDMVIMDDNLNKISQSYCLSRRTRAILLQNLIFSIGVKFLFLGLVSAGLIGMLGAVIADVGVTLITILNALRQLTHMRATSGKERK